MKVFGRRLPWGTHGKQSRVGRLPDRLGLKDRQTGTGGGRDTPKGGISGECIIPGGGG
jgi:hypothetical protein